MKLLLNLLLVVSVLVRGRGGGGRGERRRVGEIVRLGELLLRRLLVHDYLLVGSCAKRWGGCEVVWLLVHNELVGRAGVLVIGDWYGVPRVVHDLAGGG